jgi:hypothetical protein
MGTLQSKSCQSGIATPVTPRHTNVRRSWAPRITKPGAPSVATTFLAMIAEMLSFFFELSSTANNGGEEKYAAHEAAPLEVINGRSRLRKLCHFDAENTGKSKARFQHQILARLSVELKWPRICLNRGCGCNWCLLFQPNAWLYAYQNLWSSPFLVFLTMVGLGTAFCLDPLV